MARGEPGRGPGWLAVGGGCPPSPPPTSGGPAGLWAGGARVSQAGFSLRLWGRRASAAERVPPSPIRLRRLPARPRFPPPGVCCPPASQTRPEPAPGRRVRIRARELRGARSGASMVSATRGGSGTGLGVGGGAGLRELAFPVTLAKPQPWASEVPV